MLTEDLNFFYRLNKELKRFQIKFDVLNVGKKIPNIPNSIILSTFEEMKSFENFDKIKDKILPFSKNDDFEQYIVKVLAAKKIGNKNFSELVFSIDPGIKHLGLVIFLDDYYLNSHTIYNNDKLIERLQTYILALQEGNPNPLKIMIKFGRGIIPVSLELIEKIFTKFKKIRLMVYLIDETKSSKYKIRDEAKRKVPKDEAAALIISLRDGIEVNPNNFRTTLQNINQKKWKKEEFHNKYSDTNEEIDSKVIEIAESLLNGSLSLSKSIELIKIKEKANYIQTKL